MHKLSICFLLALVPFTGLRMICVDAPRSPSKVERGESGFAPRMRGTTTEGTADSAAARPPHSCERVDPLLDAPGTRLQCLFVPHPSQLVLLVVSPLAPPPVSASLQVDFVTVGIVPAEFRTLYVAPRFPPQTPPPKA